MEQGLPAFVPGSVWLVGAGPGDPGLLTRLAAHALAEADMIFTDALVGAEILALASPRAVIRDVGKRGRAPSARQEAINQALVRAAQAGHRVLRLKGGDPFVFGRGQEEAAALAAAGIAFRVVPGVTAGIGGLAYAGIAATRRGGNNAVTFLTGHEPDDAPWDLYARPDHALVVYMGLGTLDAIATRLIGAGRDPSTPVAIVSDASLPTQRTLLTDLGHASLEIRRARIAPPAIVAIGPIAATAAMVPWYAPSPAAAQTPLSRSAASH